jgi:predicted RNase H-like HicB family nuclease
VIVSTCLGNANTLASARCASDQEIRFDALCALLRWLGFVERHTDGSHHVFYRAGIPEILNVQPRKDGSCKPYQARQVRDISLKHGLSSGWTPRLAMSPDYRYEIVIYWSEPDQAFVAEVPELAGCAADGPTYRGALEQAELAIGEWVSTAAELGREIPKPRGRLVITT